MGREGERKRVLGVLFVVVNVNMGTFSREFCVRVSQPFCIW